MNLYIKQKVFSWNDRFFVYDENGNEKYYVEGEVFTLGKRLHLYDTSNNQLSYIHEKIPALLPKFRITMKDGRVATVAQKFSLFKPHYTVDGPNWTVVGNFLIHEYRIIKDERPIAYISKQWFTWGDTYKISFNDDIEPAVVLSVVLVIDACIERQSTY